MSSANLPIKALGETPLTADGVTFKSISETVCRVTENKAPRGWWIAFLLAFSFTGDAEAECAAFHKKTGRVIKLITVQEILDEQHVQKM